MNDSPQQPHAAPPSADRERSPTLPFPKWWPIVTGACVGIFMRWAVFSGHPGDPYAAMMGSFIYLSPLLVGAITVYFAETIQRRSWGYYIAASFIANVLYIVGTLLIMIEGWICAIVIVPLFAAFGIVGGLIMGAVCRLTRWPRHTVYSLAALPLVLGFFETNLPLPDHVTTIERSVLINAPPQVVWRNIHYTPHIDAKEADAWIYLMGAPLPQTGITEQAPHGRVRKITMRKGVQFEQLLVDWEENRRARWVYHFTEDSFPPGSLDEHVVIGGHYFDMQEGAFTLTPRGDATELSMSIRYRLSTQFNWYASPIARALMGNLETTVLEFYRRHSESPTQGGA